MKKTLLFASLFFVFQFVAAQNKAYFQQEANYIINVSLDDNAHTISGNIEIEYVNNSPDVLPMLYFHLWGNAFSETNTAYGEQELRTGSTQFYFAKDSELGGYSGLDFTVDGEKAALVFDPKNPDIATLILPKPLKSSGKVVIKTPFVLKIPASFSRLGHVGTSYQMTQWYPKPAVYDHKGWHQMPYLDQGEFYSEFGNFDVTLTLPDNYVVGATGTLQTESERQFLEQKVQETQALAISGFSKDTAFPASSASMKTIRYTAEKVHDFAWFADKRFHVLKEKAVLPSGKTVDAWAMFSNEQAAIWTKGAEYVRRSVEFYSENVGEYPWPQATAVHSALSAGGGMEYPMITVIGNSGSAKALDDVITHEVGHNWFYGILASNERDHAWMDEGINSFYEYRYMRQFYGERIPEGLPDFIKKSTDMDLYEMAYLFLARRNMDQAPETTSNSLNSFNYGVASYLKTGSAFLHLEEYLGKQKFDAIMHEYYQFWGFRHPYPEDLRGLFEEKTGLELGWFFDGYIGSNDKLDYSLCGIEKEGNDYQILTTNKGDIAAPFPVSGIKNGQIVETKWFEGFAGRQKITFPNGDYDQFTLDAGHVTLDVLRKNNHIKTGGILKKTEPLQLKFLGAIEDSRRTRLHWMPTMGANKYDGFMAGLNLFNTTVPAKKLEFASSTLYGFGSKDVVGMAGLKYNIFPKSETVKKISIGLNSKTFNFRSPDSLRTETGFTDTHLQYRRFVPFVRVELARSPVSKFYQVIELRSIWKEQEEAVFEVDSTGAFYTGNEWNGRIINELSWELGDKRVLNPYSFRAALEQGNYDDAFGTAQKYVRASLEWKTAYTFEKGKQFSFRVFAGKFFQSEKRKVRGLIYDEAFSLTSQGYNDYRFDDLYFGRTETQGLLSQQIMLKEGGMKVALGSPYSEGRSNDFICAINLKSDLPEDLPGKLPIKPYFDLGYYNDARTISNDLSFSDQVWWQGGLALEFGKGIFGLYFPIVNSKNVKDLYNQSGRGSFFNRISFSLDLLKLDPWRLLEGVSF